MKQLNRKNKILIVGFGFILSLLSLSTIQADSVEIPKNPIQDENKTQIQIKTTILPQVLWVAPNKTLKSGEPLSGKITIVNSTNQAKTSTIKLYFVLKNTLETDNIIEQSSIIYASYNVPPFRKNTYRFQNGPSMRVKKDTFVYLIADNNSTTTRAQEFLILK